MAKILKEGTLHKRMAWFCTCNTCGSELRILQGDPIATNPVIYICDTHVHKIRYICPVCGQRKVAEYGTWPYITEKNRAKYKEIILDQEDLKEIEGWENDNITITDDDKDWINNRL